MEAFCTVVEEGTFAGAGRKLARSTSSISKHVAALESALDTRLLQRTTRSVGLTAAGRAYYERVSHLLDEISTLEKGLRGEAETLAGTLRVAAPMSLGLARISTVLPRFLDRHPDIHVEFALSDRRIDIVEEGVDVAIRVAESLPDSTLIATRIGAMPTALVASPAYLARCGEPEHPEDLAGHACIRYSRIRTAEHWRFSSGDEEHAVGVRGPLSVDNSLAMRASLVHGMGLAVLPEFAVEDELRAGTLVRCMVRWSPPQRSVYGVYPTPRHLSAKVRAFLAFMREVWSQQAPA